MADNFDLVVDFDMNEEGAKKVVAEAKSAEQAIRSMDNAVKDAGKTTKQVMDENSDHLKSYSTSAVNEGKKVEKSFEDQAKAAAKAATAQGHLWSIQARQLNTQGRLLQLQARDLTKYADAFNILGRTALVAGTAVSGGIFKAANDFVKNAPQATRLTLEWKQAQDSLQKSYSKFGEVSARIALPLLEEAARLAAKAANFMESNPGIVKAALNVGLITAGLGLIATLVSKGIKLQADLLFIQSVPIMQEAAALNMAAAEQMLVAAQLNAEAKGIEVAEATTSLGAGATKGAGLAGLFSDLAIPLAVLTASVWAADKAFDAITGQDVKFKDYVTTFKQALALDAKTLGDQFAAFKATRTGTFDASIGQEWFKRVGEALGVLEKDAGDAADELDRLAGSVEGSPAFEKILDAYEKYKTADLKLVQDHYRKRQSIIDDALRDEIEANRKYQSQVSDVGNNTSKQLTELQQKYDADYLKAEREHTEKRASILQDAGDDIKKIESDLQEQLRKNFIDHQNRTEDIIAARDALGLAKENRRFEQQQAEERRSANIEIRRRRQDLAQRLQELDIEFAQERQQRLADFIARQEEIRQQAAERLKELAAQHQEELRKIREQAAAKIKEEDTAFIAERKRRYDYFLQTLKDLDASLLGERNLKQKYQALEIQDLDAFLSKYRAGLASMSDLVPHKAAGNYTSGLVMTGEHGYEWIATHASTRAAEDIIGGKLTQEMFLRAMMALRASTNATYIDQRRIDRPLSRENKDAYVEGATTALKEVLGVR